MDNNAPLADPLHHDPFDFLDDHLLPDPFNNFDPIGTTNDPTTVPTRRVRFAETKAPSNLEQPHPTDNDQEAPPVDLRRPGTPANGITDGVSDVWPVGERRAVEQRSLPQQTPSPPANRQNHHEERETGHENKSKTESILEDSTQSAEEDSFIKEGQATLSTIREMAPGAHNNNQSISAWVRNVLRAGAEGIAEEDDDYITYIRSRLAANANRDEFNNVNATPDEADTEPHEPIINELGAFMDRINREEAKLLAELAADVIEEGSDEQATGTNDDEIHHMLYGSANSSDLMLEQERELMEMEHEDGSTKEETETPSSTSSDETDDESNERTLYARRTQPRIDYRNPELGATVREIQAIAFHTITAKYLSQHEMIDDMREFIFDFYDRYNNSKKIPTIATFRKIMTRVTHLKPRYFDVCRAGCICFSGEYEDKKITECPCGLPRYNPRREVAFTQFMIIPIIPRIRLWMSDRILAQLLRTYPQYARQRAKGKGLSGRRYTDFWFGSIVAELESKGLFTGDMDLHIALVVGLDGVKVFKTRYPFNTWPVIFSCLNLPIEIRNKRSNLLVAGSMPGPKNPGNMDTFLHPIFQELEKGNKGIKMWDAYREAEVMVYIHLVILTTDMPGRTKVTKFLGEYISNHSTP